MTILASPIPSRLRRPGVCMLLALFLAAASASGQDDGRRHLALDDYLSWETVASPRISPDGATVVYERRFVDPVADGVRSELWVIGADGSRNRFLTEGAGPRWAPDGTRIAFTRSGEPRGSQVFVRWMDAEGAGRARSRDWRTRRRRSGGRPTAARSPSERWSPPRPTRPGTSTCRGRRRAPTGPPRPASSPG